MTKAKRSAAGQAGDPIELPFDKLNESERSILKAISNLEKTGPVKNANIRSHLGWDKPDPKKGSSRVRNGLRRLVRGGWVVHNNEIGDGQYSTSEKVARFMELMFDQEGGPAPAEVKGVFLMIKRPDCAFYNACLQQAIDGAWANFSCETCQAYILPDQEQRMQDMVALRVLETAAEIVERDGKLGRVRGARPASDREEYSS